jgi:hypothetical protein
MMSYQPKCCARTGIAPIELLITFPLLAVLFITLLTTAAAGLLSFDVAVAARNRAWDKIETSSATSSMHLPISPTLESELAQIFRADQANRSQTPSPTQIGLIEERAEARLTFGYEAIVRQLPSAKRRHSVLGDSWDHRRIEFDTAADESLPAENEGGKHHFRLCLDSRIQAFSPKIRLDAFRYLTKFSSTSDQ